MSFFNNRQPEMFDAKKRFGSGGINANSERAFNSDEGESAPESWVELALVELVSAAVWKQLSPVKYRLVKDIKNTDWIWDWSSRPEKQEHIPSNKLTRNRSGQGPIGSTLTTPPNSPEPELSSEFEFKTSKVQKQSSVFLRFEVIVGLVVSNVLTFVLGATIGNIIILYYLSS
uniref:Uncharacterized protein n=1 Tax=Ditylenchus dipsaci TaxID=166011 RepID=A0A915E8A4_9BILA